MMRLSAFRYVLFTLLLIGSFSFYTAAQADQVVGGYGPTSVRSSAVRKAAKFAVRSHGKAEGRAITLVKINKAEQQVVSGMNYRLCMTVRHGKHGRAHGVIAVVYQPIRKPMELTSFEEGDCED